MTKGTLIIALSSYAGMGPYVATIVNSFSPNDPAWFVLGEDDRHYFTVSIKKELREKCMIVYRADSAVNKLRGLFVPDNALGRKIEYFISNKNIENIHLLTGEMALRGMIGKWNKEYKLFLTVHDLHPHKAKKTLHKMWRQRQLYKMLDKMMAQIPNLVTNSQSQYSELQQMFPRKKISFHDFPTLITEEITNGNIVAPEIKGKQGYVLFFGRIEQYKGLHILYEAWCNSCFLHDNYTLIIAGAGDIYFNRRQDEKNIVFINRYIKDEEIASLYKNAACTVYPYISATQSGVLSLSCYFQTPIVASDVPFFKHIAEEAVGITFHNGDSKELALKLLEAMQVDNNSIKKRLTEYYSIHYNVRSMNKNLMQIYN